jgi:hypothetical protein
MAQNATMAKTPPATANAILVLLPNPSFTSFYVQVVNSVLVQFDCGTRILRVIHGRDARATLEN